MEAINWAEKEISSSALKYAKVSTRNLLWYYSKPKDKKSHFDFGSAIELYILEREKFKEQVAILDESKRPFPDKDYKTKANKEWKDKFYSENEGKYIINAKGSESLEQIEEIQKLIDDHPVSDLLFADGNELQKEWRWTCPISGLKRYARTDISNDADGIIVDVKTYQNDFERDAANMDHFLQAWDQITGMRENGVEVNAYYWFAISKVAPYHVDFYTLDLDQCLRVEEIYSSILYRLKNDLLDNNYIPPYHKTDIQKIKVPNYYK